MAKICSPLPSGAKALGFPRRPWVTPAKEGRHQPQPGGSGAEEERVCHQLNEKQKVKFIYGVSKSSSVCTMKEKMPGITGENLLPSLSSA